MVKVLVVCTGNTCRSPMLWALLKDALVQAGIEAEVESAGLAAMLGQPAAVHAAEEMQARGLSLDEHRVRHVDDVDLSSYDRIYCMSASHAAQLPGASVVGVGDPFGESRDVYTATADQLATVAQDIAHELAS